MHMSGYVESAGGLSGASPHIRTRVLGRVKEGRLDHRQQWIDRGEDAAERQYRSQVMDVYVALGIEAGERVYRQYAAWARWRREQEQAAWLAWSGE